ncbi:glycerate kinase [Yinghuangia sp. ASG 101]|nr:glycerate kinase [Yinghuangia sp. ASG 101]UGQ11178.1 glycerate kinase [Yinghuangia sp. ASG 101]
MRVLFAPDAFKGTIDAADAAQALADGWLDVRPGDETVILPLADGGEGTLDAVARGVPDAVRRPIAGVSEPDGRAVDSSWLLLPDGTALVELASVSGLPLLDAPDPLGAHTAGLGTVIADALHTGATAARQLSSVIARYSKVDLLCLDEFGYANPDKKGSKLLFRIFTEREEAKPPPSPPTPRSPNGTRPSATVGSARPSPTASPSAPP